jgi:hypothetical protein
MTSTSDPKCGKVVPVNRLLAKLRPAERSDRPNVRLGHVRIVGRDYGVAGSGRAYVLTAAETAPCTCPDFCERDHANE